MDRLSDHPSTENPIRRRNVLSLEQRDGDEVLDIRSVAVCSPARFGQATKAVTLSNQVMNDFAVNVGQSVVTTLESIR